MRNLTLLLEYLRTVDAAQFSLAGYAKTSTEDLGPVDPECRTSACALGYACDIFPEFVVVKTELDRSELQYCGFITSHFSQDVCDFFGINCEEATGLFGPRRRTLEQQITYMEAFISEKLNQTA